MKAFKIILASLYLLFSSVTLFAQKSNKVKDQGMTSPMHEKYVEKIVFSKSVIKREGADESTLGKEFSIKDQIFFRVFMKESIYNALCDKGYSVSFLDRDSEFYILIKLDGETAYRRKLYIRGFMSDDEKKVFSTFRACFKQGDDEIGASEWKEFLEQKQQALTTGKHNIKVEIYGREMRDKPDFNGVLLASGEFSLNVVANYIDANDPNSCLPKAQMVNKVLEDKMLKAFKGKGWQEQPKEVRITDASWTIIKNKITGAIIKRTIQGIVASTNGDKCQYQAFGFSQDYDGAKYQDNLYMDNIGDQKGISCKCFK